MEGVQEAVITNNEEQNAIITLLLKHKAIVSSSKIKDLIKLKNNEALRFVITNYPQELEEVLKDPVANNEFKQLDIFRFYTSNKEMKQKLLQERQKLLQERSKKFSDIDIFTQD